MAKQGSIRIHIIGCAPRSGTTLLFELFTSCFAVARFGNAEISLFRAPRFAAPIFCSKNPGDAQVVAHMLPFDSKLWSVYLVRDPRDVIVSTHLSAPNRYWVDLDVWLKNDRFARRLYNHPRFIVVRYEDLVNNPNNVQSRLLSKMPFLTKRNDFSDFKKVATPPELAVLALRGVREINNSSVGNWRNHLPRVAGQIALHGDIRRRLKELSYEENDNWMEEIAGVAPNFELGADPWTSSKKATLFARVKGRLRLISLEGRYILGLSKKE